MSIYYDDFVSHCRQNGLPPLDCSREKIKEFKDRLRPEDLDLKEMLLEYSLRLETSYS